MGKRDGRSWIEVGENQEFALMLACPGWFEEFHGRPAAGDVAKNLDTLLEILGHWSPGFPNRDALTITNATSFALWEERHGTSLPTDEEIEDARNLDGLRDEIGHIQRWLICFGPHAIHAGTCLRDRQPRRLHPDCEVIEVTWHLANRSLIHIEKDLARKWIEKGDKRATRKRLAVIADQILKAMGRGNQMLADDIGPWDGSDVQRHGRF